MLHVMAHSVPTRRSSVSSGNLGWDNIDLRYARTFSGDGHDGIWGVSLNNNPSVTDVFATAPAWQYPFMAPDLAPGAPAAPILAGGLGGQVIGANAYAQIDGRSEEHTSELQSLMRISYAVFCLK